MGYQYSFEKLEVWHDARGYVVKIYAITEQFLDKEKYGLCSQLRRAAVSVVSNIAEGVSRKNDKEQLRFLEIAYASLMETFCQLCVAMDLKYIDEKALQTIKEEIDKISNKLNALSRAIEKRIATTD